MDHREYPFTPDDNRVLSDVAKRMKIFAYLMLGSAVLSLLMTAYQMFSFGAGITTIAGGMIGTIFSLIIYSVIAFLTLSASGALEAAARSGGRDVTPMMHALNALKKLYAVQYWLIITMILLVILVMIGVFVAMFALG